MSQRLPASLPVTPADLLSVLRGIPLDRRFDLLEQTNRPSQTDTLWDAAEAIAGSDPDLPQLPVKPDGGRQRHASLMRWCEECTSSSVDLLASAFTTFRLTLNAATVPARDGGRKIDGVPHAVALSEAAEALEREIGAELRRLFQRHGRQSMGLPEGMRVEHADTPDGPWTPVQDCDIVPMSMKIGGDGADAVLIAALESARRAVAFPVEKWNAMQAAHPGANHQRFHAGEVISPQDLATVESAINLLQIKYPSPQPTDAAAVLKTISESNAALDRLVQSMDGQSGKRKQSKRKRKPTLNKLERPLTVLELHTLEVVGRHCRNFAAAAFELRRDPKTVRENYNRALNKSNRIAGHRSRSAHAGRLPEDRRGQPDISSHRG